jgi:pyrroloquinoline quinone (PQQ) biosynthesis protein C
MSRTSAMKHRLLRAAHREFLHAPIHISDILHMNAALAVQTERIRAMTADEKVRVAHALWVQAREALASGVRARNPEYSTTQVAERVRELMRDAGA